jgi:hypothetical protein
MLLNFGPNYVLDYQNNSSTPAERQKKIDEYLAKFMYILEMKVGAANISENLVSERVILNKTMQVKNSLDSSAI